MRFYDHAEIGRLLAEHVERLGAANPVVLALPPGGVRIGKEIAQRLGVLMDVIMAKEICIPGSSRHPLGCTVEGRFHPDRAACASQKVELDYAQILAAAECKELVQRENLMRRGKPAIEFSGRTVILVGDGSTDAVSLRAAVTAVRDRGAGDVIYAAPVAAPGVAGMARPPAIASLFDPDEYRSVMLVNEGNRQTTDEEIAEILGRSRGGCRAGAALALVSA